MGITYGDHLIDSGYRDITPEQERELDREEQRKRFVLSGLRRAVDLIDAMMTNDPNEPVSDAGHTALDLWKHEAAQLRALVNAKE